MFSSFTLEIIAAVSQFVKLPNGTLAKVTHVGSVKLSHSIVLQNVLCVPSFAFNLLSVSCLLKTVRCALILLSGVCFIQDLCSWTTIGLAKERNGLFYMLNITSPQPKHFVNFITSTVSDLWHLS